MYWGADMEMVRVEQVRGGAWVERAGGWTVLKYILSESLAVLQLV